MAIQEALQSGLAGAAAVTAVHEIVRRNVGNAPRMDILGERAIARIAEAMGTDPPQGNQLHSAAMAGDIAANSLYYSLIGVGNPESAWLRGAAMGLVAGLGAVVLPGPLGLGTAPSNRTNATRIMTVAWYTLGGLAAAGVYRCLTRNQ